MNKLSAIMAVAALSHGVRLPITMDENIPKPKAGRDHYDSGEVLSKRKKRRQKGKAKANG